MRAIRLGICVSLTFAVLAFGAVELWASSILEISAALLFLLWGWVAIRQKQAEIVWNWLYVPLLGLGCFILAQEVFEFSVYPYATKLELLRWAAYLLFFFLTVQSFHVVEEFASLGRFLLGLSFLVSLAGIVQHFTFNGKLYWFVVLHQGGEPFGPFVNHNHFAGFVELTVPLGLAALLGKAVRQDKVPVLVLLTAIPIGALVLSASRGGISSFLLQLVLLGFLLRDWRAAKAQILEAIVLVLVAGALIVWLGVGDTVQRFESLAAEDISHDQRVSLFRDTWQIFRQHPWTGTGLGTLETVYPAYESFYSSQKVDHAHNDYVELLADTGVIGGVFALVFICVTFWRGLSNLRSCRSSAARALYAGALVGCAGLLVHGLVDFNFHIPSNALLFLILAALATTRTQREPDAGSGEPPVRDRELDRVPLCEFV